MKKIKIIILAFFAFIGAFCFCQDYDTLYETALSYEYEKNWFYAYATFFDLLEKYPDSSSIDAYNEFIKIDEAFKNGKPGLDEYNENNIEQAWKNLALNFEKYWTYCSPKYFYVSNLERTAYNYFKKSANYSVVIDYDDTDKYKILSSSVYEGFKKSYSEKWKEFPSSWPLESIHKNISNNYFENETALVDIGGSVSPAALISWHDVNNGVTNSFYDIKFNLTDLDGNIIYQGSRNIAGYKIILTLEDIPQSTMKLIETHNVNIVPTGLFLEYGKIDFYDSNSRDWILELPELNISSSDFEFYFNNLPLSKPNPIEIVGKLCRNDLVKDFIKYHKVEGVSFETICVLENDFAMGREDGEIDEKPSELIHLSSYELSRTEITQRLYENIMKENPSYDFIDEGVDYKNKNDFPVQSVSWFDAIYFCNLLSIAEGFSPCYSILGETNPYLWNYEIHSGDFITDEIICDFSADGYRLPTEAEWEYAACGGALKNETLYSGSNNLDEVAWYNENSNDVLHSVGLKKMNELGLYDMTGNVWEWCWDWYAESYNIVPSSTSLFEYDDDDKIVRGGGFQTSDEGCTVTYRGISSPKSVNKSIGFRVCKNIISEISQENSYEN